MSIIVNIITLLFIASPAIIVLHYHRHGVITRIKLRHWRSKSHIENDLDFDAIMRDWTKWTYEDFYGDE